MDELFIMTTKAKCECGWEGSVDEVGTKVQRYLRTYQNEERELEYDVDEEMEPTCPKCGSNCLEFT